jgi:hypothetical protein
MQKIRVRGNESYLETRDSHHFKVLLSAPAWITVVIAGGARFAEKVMYHRGYLRDPMTRDDIGAKWDTICAGLLDDDRRDAIRAARWDIAVVSDVSELVVDLSDLGPSH